MIEFEPGYKDFQRDIERYLTSIGQREKRPDGILVFRGYDDALSKMFRLYLDEGDLEPLVRHFRSWNWEYGYNDYLLELTEALKQQGDWPGLKLLWEKGVLRCRKKLYNDLRKLEKDAPDLFEPESLETATARLIEALEQIIALAEAFGSTAEVEEYQALVQKVERGNKV